MKEEEFGKQIQWLRQHQGLSQRALARNTHLIIAINMQNRTDWSHSSRRSPISIG